MHSLKYEWSLTSGCKDIWIEMKVCGKFFQTMEKDDDIIAILNLCIWCCYKANSIIRHLNL